MLTRLLDKQIYCCALVLAAAIIVVASAVNRGENFANSAECRRAMMARWVLHERECGYSTGVRLCGFLQRKITSKTTKVIWTAFGALVGGFALKKDVGNGSQICVRLFFEPDRRRDSHFSFPRECCCSFRQKVAAVFGFTQKNPVWLHSRNLAHFLEKYSIGPDKVSACNHSIYKCQII